MNNSIRNQVISKLQDIHSASNGINYEYNQEICIDSAGSIHWNIEGITVNLHLLKIDTSLIQNELSDVPFGFFDDEEA